MRLLGSDTPDKPLIRSHLLDERTGTDVVNVSTVLVKHEQTNRFAQEQIPLRRLRQSTGGPGAIQCIGCIPQRVRCGSDAWASDL